eukprot:Awhi_evm1s10666
MAYCTSYHLQQKVKHNQDVLVCIKAVFENIELCFEFVYDIHMTGANVSVNCEFTKYAIETYQQQHRDLLFDLYNIQSFCRVCYTHNGIIRTLLSSVGSINLEMFSILLYSDIDRNYDFEREIEELYNASVTLSVMASRMTDNLESYTTTFDILSRNLKNINMEVETIKMDSTYQNSPSHESTGRRESMISTEDTIDLNNNIRIRNDRESLSSTKKNTLEDTNEVETIKMDRMYQNHPSGITSNVDHNKALRSAEEGMINNTDLLNNPMDETQSTSFEESILDMEDTEDVNNPIDKFSSSEDTYIDDLNNPTVEVEVLVTDNSKNLINTDEYSSSEDSTMEYTDDEVEYKSRSSILQYKSNVNVRVNVSSVAIGQQTCDKFFL